MTESQFIEQNKEKWRELESLLAKKVRDPERLYQLFEQVSGDLSYARTFYPNRSVRLYLNNLTLRIFDLVGAKKQSTRWHDLIHLFRYEIPSEVVRAWPAFLISFLIFLSSVLIGIISSFHQPQFARTILGHEYIDMTEQNINSGDPMAVYKKDAKVDMFLGITINNVRVAFLAFVLGLIGGVGTIILLVTNGIMVGVFQYFFYSKGLFLTSFLTIWIHGTIEISSIIIAGAAGLVLGQGLLFPQTYDRLTSLQLSARRAIKILIGTVPLFILAGFLEAFVTRMTSWAIPVKAAIIAGSGFFVLYMWVWIPWRFRSILLFQPEGNYYSPLRNIYSPANEFRNFEQILTFVFTQIREIAGKYLRYFFLPALSLMVVIFWYRLEGLPIEVIAQEDENINLWSFNHGGMIVFILIWLLTTIFLFLSGHFVANNKNDLGSSYMRKAWIPVSIIAFMVSSFLYFLPDTYTLMILILVGPHTLIAANNLICRGQFSWSGLVQEFSFSYRNYFSFLIPLLITAVLWFILFLFFNTALSSFLIEFISWHELFRQPILNEAFYRALIKAMLLLVSLPFYYLLVKATYDAQWIKYQAADLKERLKYFGEPESNFE